VAVEASDVADQIREATAADRAEQREIEHFRTRAAVVIAVLAVLLAISNLGGDNATKETINNNIKASDTWAFYQAKNIRQTDYRLAADQLQATLALHGDSIGADAQSSINSLIGRYRDTADRYETEPGTGPCGGEGKKELLACATDYEQKRDHAIKQDPNFDYSTALFQIAIVLGSVAILATSRAILAMSLVFGAVSVVLMLNGFLLLFELPLG